MVDSNCRTLIAVPWSWGFYPGQVLRPSVITHAKNERVIGLKTAGVQLVIFLMWASIEMLLITCKIIPSSFHTPWRAGAVIDLEINQS